MYHQEDGQQLVHVDPLCSDQLLHYVSDQQETKKRHQLKPKGQLQCMLGPSFCIASHTHTHARRAQLQANTPVKPQGQGSRMKDGAP